MPVQVIADIEQSAKAFNLMKSTFAARAEVCEATVAFRPTQVEAEVLWNQESGIWSLFWSKPPKEGHRYWICHGLENPRTTRILRIGIETNPPHQGVNKMVGAAFVRDETGKISLFHTGRLGGGSQNQKYKQKILDSLLGNWERRWIPDLGKEMIFLGDLCDPSIIDNIAKYASLFMRARESEPQIGHQR